MKVVILAGGYGTRLSEDTIHKPKPMVEIGPHPILWHIMKIYSYYGFNEFIILLGYKGYMIKEYFYNYFLHQSDVTLDLKNNKMEVHDTKGENWKVTLIDTGKDTLTGGRIKRAEDYINNETFMLTYGDGVANIFIEIIIVFHNSNKGKISMTASQPNGRFGALKLKGNVVEEFKEKPKGDGSWVNAGFMVCEPDVMDYITEGDKTIFEQTPLKNLAKDGELRVYKHKGFWLPMDTVRDKNILNEYWIEKKALWKLW